MKTYSIGREVSCNIVINDRTDVISRRHAVLTVSSSGKMTITDLSSNGTYVNGIRISPNTPVPVTRKDNVSFAHTARLDWNQIPKTVSPLRWVLISLAALIVVAGVVVSVILLTGNTGTEKSDAAVADSAKVDTTRIDTTKRNTTKEATSAPSTNKKHKAKSQKQGSKTGSSTKKSDQKDNQDKQNDSKKDSKDTKKTSDEKRDRSFR